MKRDATENRFGAFVRGKREELLKESDAYTLRKVAGRVGFQPSYLSKVERGDTPPPSTARIMALAKDLDVDADMLLALAGKIATDVREIIMRHPTATAELIRSFRRMGEVQVNEFVRKAPSILAELEVASMKKVSTDENMG